MAVLHPFGAYSAGMLLRMGLTAFHDVVKGAISNYAQSLKLVVSLEKIIC